MKKLTKRALCALISVLMLLGTMGTVAFATEEVIIGPVDGDFVVADFSNKVGAANVVNWTDSSSKKHTMNNITNEVALRGETSFKWQHTAANANGIYQNSRLMLPKDKTGLTINEILKYDYIYMWTHCDVVNNQETLFIIDAGLGAYPQPELSLADEFGWKFHKINISQLTTKNFGVDGDEDPNSSYLSFMFTNRGWGKTATPDFTVYIDSIWLSNEDYTISEDSEEIINNDIILGDFSVLDGAKNITGKIERNSTEVTRAGKEYSLKSGYGVTGTNANERIEINKQYTLGDILAKDYMYIWMYSEVANNQEIAVVLLNSRKDSKYVKKSSKIKVDWTGWKRLKISKEEFTGWTVSSFDDASKKVTASADDLAYMWLSYTFDKGTLLEDTTLYIDSIWFSDENLDFSEKIDILSDFGNVEKNSLIGNFNLVYNVDNPAATNNERNTARYKYSAANSIRYGSNPYSVELIPSESSYYYATTNLYAENTTTGKTFTSADKLEEKYINIIMYSDAANNQLLRLNFDGYNLTKVSDSNNGRIRVFKENIITDWQGWKVLSFPLSSFARQDSKFEGALNTTEDNLKNMEVLTAIDFHFPAWYHGRKSLPKDDNGAYITEGYKYLEGNYYHDDIAEKVLSDSKYYIDSIFLSDRDMSSIEITPVNTQTENVDVENRIIVFEAPTYFMLGKNIYTNAVTVTKNGVTVPNEDYTVTQEADKLYVEFKNTLDYSTEYEVKIADSIELLYGTAKEASFKFKTADSLVINSVTFTAATSIDSISSVVTTAPDTFTNLSARLNFVNNTEENKSACMIIAVYDSNEKLVGMYKGGDTIIDAKENAYVSTSVTGSFENCTAKAFLWNMSANAMIPYSAVTPLN